MSDYQGSDGNWYHGTSGQQIEPPGSSGGGKGGGGGAMPGMAAGFLLIFIIGPIIAAKIVGFLWGLLLKLGFVGKIITTALMVVAGPFIVTLPVFMAQGLFKGMTSVQFGIVYIGSALLLPVWYWFWHYDAVKEMGASLFSSKIKNFALFLWVGLLLSIIIAAVKGRPELQGVIAIISAIAGFAYYIWATRSYGKDAERDRTFKFRWIAVAAALGLTVVYGIAAKVDVAMEDARYAKEEAQLAATVANIGGQTLTVNTSTLSLRAEPSGTSRAIKTLNKGDTVKATGNMTNGVWIPVESGSDKGYVFAMPVNLGYDSVGNLLAPYEATAAETVTIQQFVGSGETTLEQSSKAKVLQEYNGGIMVEYRNLNYHVVGDDMEKFNHVRAVSKDRPAEFNRNTPFEATVTEAINGWARMIQSTVEIPAGATVTVTGGISSSGISQAEVTFDEQELFIYWWYLKPAN
jgi:uncharacterized protein YraI